MAVVKTVRKVGTKLGAFLDQEDREFFARACVIALTSIGMLLTAAAGIGLAWRIFNLAAG